MVLVRTLVLPLAPASPHSRSLVASDAGVAAVPTHSGGVTTHTVLSSDEPCVADDREAEEQARAHVLLATSSLQAGGFRGTAFRASRVLRQSHWLCTACDIAHKPSALECYKCGAESALVLANSAADPWRALGHLGCGWQPTKATAGP